MESAVSYEFRTTCVKPFVDASIIENIAKYVEGALLYVLQPFNNSRVLRPDFFKTTGAGYNEAELKYLKSIAEPWVKTCVVR